ncbi:hypothetical protein KAX17_06065 [Candidatus Bipolaricaulota bacterium]|nr:hypothetical protein [Candidatus Bipolaricaulota bacterium]
MGRKTAWFLVLCLAMVLLLGTSVIASDQDDAGSGQDASSSQWGALPLWDGPYKSNVQTATFTGFLGSGDGTDWYRFDLQRGATISVHLAVPDTANFDVHLIPREGCVQSIYGGMGQDEDIAPYTVGSAGTCYIWVDSCDGEGHYNLILHIENQNDAGSGQDAGDRKRSAFPLGLGTSNVQTDTFTGFLGGDDTEDWYKIDLEQGQILSIDFTVPETGTLCLDLYGGSIFVAYHHSQCVAGQTNTIQYASGEDRETCYIAVTGISGGDYELNINVKNQDDAGSGQDAGSGADKAYLLDLGTSNVQTATFNAFLGGDDGADWYKIDLEEGQILSVDFTVPETVVFDVHLLRGTASYLIPVLDAVGPTNTIRYVTGRSGPCYIRVNWSSGAGPYDFTIGVRSQNDAGSGQDAHSGADEACLLDIGTSNHVVKWPWDEESDPFFFTLNTPHITVPSDEKVPSFQCLFLPANVQTGTFTGFLGGDDKEDCYKINIEPRSRVSITLTMPETADFHLSPEGPLTRDMPKDRGTGQKEAIQFVPYYTPSGPLIIHVFRNSGEGEYQLTLEVQAQNDGGLGQDAGNGPYDALPLWGGTVSGFLMRYDTADYYKITNFPRAELHVGLTVPETATLGLTWYWGLRGGPRAGGLSFGPGTYDNAINGRVAGGDYYIKVYLREGYGEYTLTVPRPPVPERDGYDVPLPKSNPDLASGSLCRGACGSDCPDTCEPQGDMVLHERDLYNDGLYYRITYPGVIRCGTHEGCRWHDACFDRCVEEYDETGDYDAYVGDCHTRCNLQVAADHGATQGLKWAAGDGPYDGYLLFSDPPIWEGPFSGSPDLVTYYIDVTTGDRIAAGTDANVFITLFGTDGRTSGQIHLDNPDKNDFESGKTSFFAIERETVGDIDHIRIRHDNTGDFAGWYLEKVSVMNSDTSEEWVFTADRWLDEDHGLSAEFSPD